MPDDTTILSYLIKKTITLRWHNNLELLLASHNYDKQPKIFHSSRSILNWIPERKCWNSLEFLLYIFSVFARTKRWFLLYRSSIPNGQPKLLLSFIPDYPLLNFLLTTTIFLSVSFSFKAIFFRQNFKTFTTWLIILQISYRVFKLTSILKEAFIPTRDNKCLYQNLIAGIAIFTSLYCSSYILQKVPTV